MSYSLIIVVILAFAMIADYRSAIKMHKLEIEIDKLRFDIDSIIERTEKK